MWSKYSETFDSVTRNQFINSHHETVATYTSNVPALPQTRVTSFNCHQRSSEASRNTIINVVHCSDKQSWILVFFMDTSVIRQKFKFLNLHDDRKRRDKRVMCPSADTDRSLVNGRQRRLELPCGLQCSETITCRRY